MNLKEHRAKVLQKLHFEKKEGTKHEEWVLHSISGSAWVTTRVSRGSQEIGKGLLRSICQQLHVSQGEFKQIAACQMSREDYCKHLTNILPPREETENDIHEIVNQRNLSRPSSAKTKRRHQR